MKISIIGLGFVGSAIYKSFKLKDIDVIGYDKYKDFNSLEKCLNTDIMFLCLPTLFDESIKAYDKSAIYEICDKLHEYKYDGLIVIKSTIEPTTIYNLTDKYNLNFVHNPEFLSANTAFEDFHNQKHIVIGYNKVNFENNNVNLTNKLIDFYKKNYPNAEISICSALESESMKIFCNSFYAVKIQFFNELYLLCEKLNCDFNTIRDLMLKNNWINPMHTNVPGSDGKLSYGGYCFPKDTNALLNFMKNMNTTCDVLEATINERNKIREN